MHFLVDAQLPPALARWISEQGHHAKHVMDIGMESASDHTIWVYTGNINAVLITKDEDFVTLFSLSPNGSRVLWLRIGNTTRRALLAWFAPLFPKIEQSLKAGETLIEIT